MTRRTVQRRCVVCRRSGDKRELLRFVARESSLVWDEEHDKPGRGAYVHKELACWSKMSQVGPFEHALKLGRAGLSPESIRGAAQACRAAIPDLSSTAVAAESAGSTGSSSRGAGRKVRL